MPKRGLPHDKLYVKVASPFEVFYEGEAYAVSASNHTGPFDILPHHANFISTLQAGVVEINTGKKKVSVDLKRGIIRVSGNKVQIFAGV